MYGLTSGAMSDPASEYACDVFITYAPDDQEWVQTYLIPRLEAASITHHDYRGFKLGHPRLDEAERLITSCRYVLLIITSHFTNDNWTQFQRILASSQGITNNQWQVIPVILEECPLPESVKMVISINWFREGDEALRRLVEHIKVSKAPDSKNERQEAALQMAARITDPFIRHLEEGLRMTTTYWQEADIPIPDWHSSFAAIYFSQQAKKVADLRRSTQTIYENAASVNLGSLRFKRRVDLTLQQVTHRSRLIGQVIKSAQHPLAITLRETTVRVDDYAQRIQSDLTQLILYSSHGEIQPRRRTQFRTLLHQLDLSLDELGKYLNEIGNEADRTMHTLN